MNRAVAAHYCQNKKRRPNTSGAARAVLTPPARMRSPPKEAKLLTRLQFFVKLLASSTSSGMLLSMKIVFRAVLSPEKRLHDDCASNRNPNGSWEHNFTLQHQVHTGTLWTTGQGHQEVVTCSALRKDKADSNCLGSIKELIMADLDFRANWGWFDAYANISQKLQTSAFAEG
uniref:C2 domain-containing protein n=1 Tax=Panagrellus redivivus TaxID=6233 RepID=A0A7E4VXU9_PANRE